MQNLMLKRAFLVDGLGSFACAVALIAGAQPLAAPLGLSATFLSITGVLLIPCAMLFFWISRTASRPLAYLGVIGNLGWVAASTVAIPILQPTMLGVVAITAQAAGVLGVAWFEYQGLKRIRAAA